MAEGFITRRGGKGGIDVSDANAVQSDVLQGKTFYSGDENIKTGTIPSKSAQTFTPITTNQTIAANQFLSGTQTILGDSDLVAGNIKDGITIFGVQGTVEADNFSLYRLGEEYTDLTGGWVIGYSELGGSQSKQSDHLLMSSSSNFSRRSYITSNKIDLTNISFINCAMDVDLNRDGGGGWLYLANNINTDSPVSHASYLVTNGIENLSLDVQSLTGSYHIGVRVRNATGSGTRNVKVYRVNLL